MAKIPNVCTNWPIIQWYLPQIPRPAPHGRMIFIAANEVTRYNTPDLHRIWWTKLSDRAGIIHIYCAPPLKGPSGAQ